MVRFCSFAFLAFALAISSGCGGAPKDAPVVAPVTGTVTFKGQPLAAGEIVFYPEKGRSARGEIKDGAITSVSTSDVNDGAPVGNLKVAVFSQVKDPSDSTGMAMKSNIPVKYNDPGTSGLSCVVEQGKSNELKFELKE